MSKIQVGQILYSRRKTESKPHEVETVGKKYFTLKDHRGRFFIENLKYDSQYSNDMQLYVDKVTLDELIEKDNLYDEIKGYFKVWAGSQSELSIHTLRSLKNILNGNRP